LLVAQGGVCAICKCLPGEQLFAVDHDHACCPGARSCGRCIRGLTCSSCNWMIGLAHDDSLILLAAVRYLEDA
jgi:hypothetical protein